LTYPKGYKKETREGLGNKKKKVREIVGGVVLTMGLIMLLGVGVVYTTFLVVSDSRELKTISMPNPRFPGETYTYWDKQTVFDAISNMSQWIIAGSILTIAGMIIVYDREVVHNVGLLFIGVAVILGVTSMIYWLYLVSIDNDTDVVFQLGIMSVILLFVGYVLKKTEAKPREEAAQKK
jgi:hypothetical protein